MTSTQLVALASALFLAAAAAVLAWPVPIALSRAGWPARTPARGLLIWQAIGVVGGLSMIGALLCAGLAALPQHPLLSALPAAALAVYLLTHLAVTVAQVLRQRRRHHALLAMLTAPHPTRARTRVIDDAVPVAYCLPRGVGSVTVLSRGLLETLAPEELAAVIAHERAHVEQRHDLLLLAFRAWRAALPWFPIAARAEEEVAALVEMLADDVARRSVSTDALARAILAVGGSGSAGGVTATTGGEGSPRMRDRFRRLVP